MIMPNCSNYIPNVKMTVEVIYPRVNVLVAAVAEFVEANNIGYNSDYEIIRRRMSKRNRNHVLDKLVFEISDDAFRNPKETNRKYIGILQNIIKCLDSDLKFDMDLIKFVSEALYDVSHNCETMGIASYYASQQRRMTGYLVKSSNETQNIHLNVYYTYNHQEDK